MSISIVKFIFPPLTTARIKSLSFTIFGDIDRTKCMIYYVKIVISLQVTTADLSFLSFALFSTSSDHPDRCRQFLLRFVPANNSCVKEWKVTKGHWAMQMRIPDFMYTLILEEAHVGLVNFSPVVFKELLWQECPPYIINTSRTNQGQYLE